MEKLKRWVLDNFYWSLCGVVVVLASFVLLSALRTRAVFYENELQKVQGSIQRAIEDWKEQYDYDARVLLTMAEVFRDRTWSDSLETLDKIAKMTGEEKVYEE